MGFLESLRPEKHGLVTYLIDPISCVAFLLANRNRANNNNEDQWVDGRTGHYHKNLPARIYVVTASSPDVLELNDHKIERSCAIVRGQLVALQGYQDDMSKEQVLKICKDIISGMMDILEMMEE
jgi:hypothetical protein